MPDLRKLIHIYLLTLTKLNRNGSKMDSQGAFQLGLGRIELIAERTVGPEITNCVQTTINNLIVSRAWGRSRGRKIIGRDKTGEYTRRVFLLRRLFFF